MEYIRIGSLARLLGRHPDTLRRYEKRGLIPAARRDPVTSWRVWTLSEVKALQKQLAPLVSGGREAER